jgi:site-specific DNA-cytosine methylase
MTENTPATDGFVHIDLCCGLGGWQSSFQEADGWRSFGLDIRGDLEADVVADVRNLPVDYSPTLLTMSPPCTNFSRYSMPWCDEPNPDMSIVRACLDAADELQPDFWILENVRGLKQYWDVQEQKRIGPYYLWGEFPPFDVALSDGGKMDVSGANPEKRAEIPPELSESLRRSVEVFSQ